MLYSLYSQEFKLLWLESRVELPVKWGEKNESTGSLSRADAYRYIIYLRGIFFFYFLRGKLSDCSWLMRILDTPTRVQHTCLEERKKKQQLSPSTRQQLLLHLSSRHLSSFRNEQILFPLSKLLSWKSSWSCRVVDWKKALILTRKFALESCSSLSCLYLVVSECTANE